jgi:putative restriction endonuclease
MIPSMRSRINPKTLRRTVRTSWLSRTLSRRDWTRDERIVAFNLYCKIPFGRIHARNPPAIDMAKAIGRTPSAVSRKFANFARLDLALHKSTIVSATYGARTGVEIWDEFSSDWDKLTFESERLLKKLTGQCAPPDFNLR